MSDDETFESTQASGALTYPIQCSALRKNGYAMLKGKPCKIVDMSTSKTGKHGHAKVNLVGVDIFDGKKYEDMSPSTHNMDVPLVTRKEYNLLDVMEDGYLCLMDDSGETRDDIHCNGNPDLLVQIQKDFDDGKEIMISILKALGRELPIAIKPIAGK